MKKFIFYELYFIQNCYKSALNSDLDIEKKETFLGIRNQ